MEIVKFKHTVGGKVMKGQAEYDVPLKLHEMIERWGEDRTYMYARYGLLGALRQKGRSVLAKTGSVEQAAAAITAWTPPRTGRRDPLQRAVNALQKLGLSKEQQSQLHEILTQEQQAE